MTLWRVPSGFKSFQLSNVLRMARAYAALFNWACILTCSSGDFTNEFFSTFHSPRTSGSCNINLQIFCNPGCNTEKNLIYYLLEMAYKNLLTYELIVRHFWFNMHLKCKNWTAKNFLCSKLKVLTRICGNKTINFLLSASYNSLLRGTNDKVALSVIEIIWVNIPIRLILVRTNGSFPAVKLTVTRSFCYL